jgi:hypothetical protein
MDIQCPVKIWFSISILFDAFSWEFFLVLIVLRKKILSFSQKEQSQNNEARKDPLYRTKL